MYSRPAADPYYRSHSYAVKNAKKMRKTLIWVSSKCFFILESCVSESTGDYFHTYYVSYICFLSHWHVIPIFNYVNFNLIWPLLATSTAENDLPAWCDLETSSFENSVCMKFRQRRCSVCKFLKLHVNTRFFKHALSAVSVIKSLPLN